MLHCLSCFCVVFADTARRLLLGTAAIALALAWSVGANAADLQWSANGVTPGGGGTGNWNTSAPALWFNGSTFQTWNNATLDNAIFGGTAGTVTINAPVTAHNLTFNTSGYTVARTLANTLTLAGATPTISMASGISATVSSVIAGTAGLTKAGLGTLTVSGANTYTGATNVNAGSCRPAPQIPSRRPAPSRSPPAPPLPSTTSMRPSARSPAPAP